MSSENVPQFQNSRNHITSGHLVTRKKAEVSDKILKILENNHSNMLKNKLETKKQNRLVSLWKKGQEIDKNGDIEEQKIVVINANHVNDLVRDLWLLASTQALSAKEQWEAERWAKFVTILSPYLSDIPRTDVVYKIVSSHSTAERDAIPTAMNPVVLDSLFAALTDGILPEPSKDPKKAPNKWKNEKIGVMIEKHDQGNIKRIHIAWLDKWWGASGARFEIAGLQPGEVIEYSLEERFKADKFRKYWTPEEAWRKLEQAANTWIQSQKPYIKEYEKLLTAVSKTVSMEAKKGNYEFSWIKYKLEWIIFLLRCGRVQYTQHGILKPNEFMTNPEDALTIVLDYKFNTYWTKYFRDKIVELQKMAQRDFPEIAEALNFFINQDAWMFSSSF